jgi:hypothetical protein
MRKYKENEVNKEMFFAEQRDDAIKKQKEENDRRRKANAEEKALEDAARERPNRANTGGAALLDDASKPVHPTEGVLRE